MALDAIVGLAALIAFGFVFYGPWQRIWTDVTRQVLFEARDEIFDMAIQGKIPFESHEYRTIRRSIEQTIRYAHELTWTRFAYELLVRKLLTRRQSSQLYTAINNIADAEVRKEVQSKVKRALSVSAASMIFKSFPGIVLIVPLLIGFAIIYAFRRTVQASLLAHRIRELIQCDAEVNGTGVRPL